MPAEGFDILLLHALDASANHGEQASVHTVTTEAMQRAGFKLALLGHDHDGRLWQDRKLTCLYPGSPEPLSESEEPLKHSVVLVRLNGQESHVEAISFNQWHYVQLTVDLGDCTTQDEALARAEKMLGRDAISTRERRLVTLAFTGRPEFDPDVDAFVALGVSHSVIRVIVELDTCIDYSQLGREQTVRGLLARRFDQLLLKASGSSRHASIESARLCALRALEGRKVSVHEVR